MAYDNSKSVVLSEQPPTVSKTAALNRKPVSSSRPPGGNGAAGSDPGNGTLGKACFHASRILRRYTPVFLVSPAPVMASGEKAEWRADIRSERLVVLKAPVTRKSMAVGRPGIHPGPPAGGRRVRRRGGELCRPCRTKGLLLLPFRICLGMLGPVGEGIYIYSRLPFKTKL